MLCSILNKILVHVTFMSFCFHFIQTYIARFYFVFYFKIYSDIFLLAATLDIIRHELLKVQYVGCSDIYRCELQIAAN